MNKIEPVDDQIFVKCVSKYSTTHMKKSGIPHVEKASIEEETDFFMLAEVIAVGPGDWCDDWKTRSPMPCKEGDIILMEAGYITLLPEHFLGPDIYRIHGHKIIGIFKEDKDKVEIDENTKIYKKGI